MNAGGRPPLAELLSQRSWLLVETAYTDAFASYHETTHGLTNGFLGIRHTVDFEREAAVPGCYVAGVYARGLGVTRELVNLPNWLPLELEVDGEPLSPASPGARDFRRVLDLRHGLVYWSWRVGLAGGADVSVTCVALTHAVRRDVALVLCDLAVTDPSRTLTAANVFDHRFGNAYLGGLVPGLTFNHVADVRPAEDQDMLTITAEIVGDGPYVALSGALLGPLRPGGAGSSALGRGRTGRRFALEVDESGRAEVAKVVAVTHGRARAPAARASRASLRTALEQGVTGLLDEHRREWEERWRSADVRIEGDPAVQRATRFGLFQLLQASDPGASSYNVPARGFTSEYHSGHFFFNTELYLATYWRARDPRVARSFLRFRYDTLDRARAHAAAAGYDGAWYPEATDDRGDNAGPHTICDYRTGTTYVEWSVKEVVHLGADVTYSLARYLDWTGDEAFAIRYGLPVAIEAARFAASRAEWDPQRERYVVRSVMGVDEYHYHVDNNAFTNGLFAWSLEWTADAVTRLREDDPARWEALAREVSLDVAEVERWREVARLLVVPGPLPGGDALEQHDGYAALPEAPIRRSADGGDPRARLTPDERERSDVLANFSTKLIKQADVVMAMYLLPERFGAAETRASFEYYEPRTSHDSSLSATPYALVAARLGKTAEAYELFRKSVRYNLAFRPRRDYRNGIHLAAYAGAWHVLLEGFAGVTCAEDEIAIRPSLPDRWRRLAIEFVYRGWRLFCDVDRHGVSLTARARGPRPLGVTIGDVRSSLVRRGQRVAAGAASGASSRRPDTISGWSRSS